MPYAPYLACGFTSSNDIIMEDISMIPSKP